MVLSQAHWIRLHVRTLVVNGQRNGPREIFLPSRIGSATRIVLSEGDNEGSLAIKLHGPVQHPDFRPQTSYGKGLLIGPRVVRLEPSET